MLIGPREGRSKKWDMQMYVPSARYSLVKGERIVRSVLSTLLSGIQKGVAGLCTRHGCSPTGIAYGTYIFMRHIELGPQTRSLNVTTCSWVTQSRSIQSICPQVR
ncbi:hypothetical protein M758_1G196300, partial [Ceratodon purpureus]